VDPDGGTGVAKGRARANRAAVVRDDQQADARDRELPEVDGHRTGAGAHPIQHELAVEADPAVGEGDIDRAAADRQTRVRLAPQGGVDRPAVGIGRLG
jgi:hypothetical protein